MDKASKPKKTTLELVKMLRDEKGVTFNIICEDDAIEYFKNINNYLRTASYRKNYPKHQSGNNRGKYINLDFAYLAELSSLDMHIRRLAFAMCIDIEHAIKTRLITAIENNPDEDGYNIVNVLFYEYNSILKSVEEKASSTFTGELIKNYFSLCDVFIVIKSSLYFIKKVVDNII